MFLCGFYSRSRWILNLILIYIYIYLFIYLFIYIHIEIITYICIYLQYTGFDGFTVV